MYEDKCVAEFFKKRVYNVPRSRALEEMTVKKGLRHKIFTARHDYYKGEWKNDLREGWGLYLANDRNKSLYEGHWRNHRPDGYGVHSVQTRNGSYKILVSGSWKNGKPDGIAYSFKNGNYYEGGFEKGKKEGFGRIWYRNEDYYEGMWKDGRKHGHGLFVFKNGNRYEGEWYKGVKQGMGVLYHMTTGQAQEGIWVNDICVSSSMRDIRYRQGSDNPTPYPIPQLGLQDWREVFNKECEAHTLKLLKSYEIGQRAESISEEGKVCVCRFRRTKCNNYL